MDIKNKKTLRKIGDKWVASLISPMTVESMITKGLAFIADDGTINFQNRILKIVDKDKTIF